jgi:hypothetical protein
MPGRVILLTDEKRRLDAGARDEAKELQRPEALDRGARRPTSRPLLP